jgi:hypothetical protein
METRELTTSRIDGAIVTEPGRSPIEGAQWYRADGYDVWIEYAIERGGLAPFSWLCTDMLLDGTDHAVFRIVLGETETGPCASA